MAASPARKAAFEILLATETRGAYADELLHGRRLSKLSQADRGLAEELTMGVLRRRGELDAAIREVVRRPLKKLDREVLWALRLGAYQLLRLDRAPAYAAVSESVELVKAAGKRSASGLANAALRKISKRGRDGLDELGEQANLPEWLWERWRERFGEETALGVVRAGLTPPETFLRLSPRFDVAETIERLRAEGVEVAATDVAGAYRVVGGRASASAVIAEGRAAVQDAGSQAVVALLDLKPGMRLLDLCAAPGGKTRAAAERLGEGNVIACDLHPHRLRKMRELGAEDVRLVATDGARGLRAEARFDRVLVDAPCSGTGTLGRNPEIKWRLTAEDLDDLAERQKAILGAGLERVAEGGALVYSTCSLEGEENEAVVAAVADGWRIEQTLERNPGRDAGDGFWAARLVRC